MWINLVCKECKLTKKAIEYYERQNLVTPIIEENGYRNFSPKDIALLKEISILRKLGLGISDIKTVIFSQNRSGALAKYKYLMSLKLERDQENIEILNKLIKSHSVDEVFLMIETSRTRNHSIKEKLAQAFPGSFGMYLSIHFGSFLDGDIDTREKEEAFEQIITFLDNCTLELSTKLEHYMEESFFDMPPSVMENINQSMVKSVQRPEEFISQNIEILDCYVNYRTSKEFLKSPVYEMQQLMVEFQKSSGYLDLFLPALRILSPSYETYCQKLNQANQVFLNRYPQLVPFYETNTVKSSD